MAMALNPNSQCITYSMAISQLWEKKGILSPKKMMIIIITILIYFLKNCAGVLSASNKEVPWSPYCFTVFFWVISALDSYQLCVYSDLLCGRLNYCNISHKVHCWWALLCPTISENDETTRNASVITFLQFPPVLALAFSLSTSVQPHKAWL